MTAAETASTGESVSAEMAEETKNDKPEKPERSGLRPAQIVAAGLAAVTAAFLGSTLGVYGTVLGAGLVSVLTTVGSELYLRSLDRTREATKKAKAVATAVSSARGWQTRIGPAVRDGEPTRITEQPTVPTAPMPVPGATTALDLDSADADDAEARTEYLAVPETDKPVWWKRRWPWLVATSAVAFVIGIAALTVFEVAADKSLTGGDGPTVGRLLGNSAAPNGTGDGEQDPVDKAPASTTEQQPAEGDGGSDGTTTTEPTETTSPETTETSEPTESEPPTETTEPTQTEQPEQPEGTEQDSGGEAGGGAAEQTEAP